MTIIDAKDQPSQVVGLKMIDVLPVGHEDYLLHSGNLSNSLEGFIFWQLAIQGALLKKQMENAQEYFEYTPGVLRAYVKPKHLDALTFTLQRVIEASGTVRYVGVSQKLGVPQNGWFIMEIPIKMDDLGVSPFSETSMYTVSFLHDSHDETDDDESSGYYNLRYHYPTFYAPLSNVWNAS